MKAVKFIASSVSKAKNLILGFLDTAPELMSDETARKLQDKEEARKYIEEIRQQRSIHKADFSASH